MDIDPATLSARCSCGTDLWAVRDGQWTLTSRVVRLTGEGQLEARCPDCRELVALPWLSLQPQPDVVQATKAVVTGRTIIRRRAVIVGEAG